MAIIPKHNTLNEIMESGDITSEPRSYLGYSELGEKCHRKIWYSFRFCFTRSYPKRIQRLFERGDWEEERIIKDLAEKGCIISDQQKEVIGVTGHEKGHIDGIAIGVPGAEKTPHLFEAKTMKASQFKIYMKDGLKIFSSKYWQQTHSYMGHLKLTRCLYVVVNKDNEERDYKRIEFDKESFVEGEGKAFNIITSENPPPRLVGANRTYFECKFCDARQVCLFDEKPKVTCRTCQFCDIEIGFFSCDKHKRKLTKEDQLAACKDYKLEDYAT